MSRTVRVLTRKWPDGPHWEYDALSLGVDVHGHWVGLPQGTWMSRPGMGMPARAPHVVLVPHDAWWIATMYGDHATRPFDVYVDVTTPAVWSGDEVRAVDLDLDVIRGVDGRVWLDDEDEFEEHQVTLGYPESVIASARASARALLLAVTERVAPFDGTHLAWMERLARLTG